MTAPSLEGDLTDKRISLLLRQPGGTQANTPPPELLCSSSGGPPDLPRAHPPPSSHCSLWPHPEGVLALDVHPVSDPGGPQLPMAPAQQDGDLGGAWAPSLQEELQGAIHGPVQVVIEDELRRSRAR